MDSVRWYRLKDEVKSRCFERCEFCALRYGVALHHRHYGTWGSERLRDVMLVCGACHNVIHGLGGWGKTVTCRPGSLLNLGDTGHGSTPEWNAYLLEARSRMWKLLGFHGIDPLADVIGKQL